MPKAELISVPEENLLTTDRATSPPATFQEVEETIEEGLESFRENLKRAQQDAVKIGAGLKVANERALYRETHDTWADYVTKRWGISPEDSWHFIGAAEAFYKLKEQDLPAPPSRRGLYMLRNLEGEELKEVVLGAQARASEDGQDRIRIKDLDRQLKGGEEGATDDSLDESENADPQKREENKQKDGDAPGLVPPAGTDASRDDEDPERHSFHPEPSTEGFLADYRKEFGTDNTGARGDGVAVPIDPSKIGVVEKDEDEDFWRDIEGDHAQAMLLAVPVGFDPSGYFKDEDQLEHELAYYATPTGLYNVHEIGYPLKIIERPQELTEAIYAYEQERTDRYTGIVPKKSGSHIDWAKQTVNPVTGCRHSCAYCYARFQAEGEVRGYAQGFHPTFHPSRLNAFDKPVLESDDPRDQRIFIDSMSDICGKWVPRWITQCVLDKLAETDWVGMILTKFPKKVGGFGDDDPLDIPSNCYFGVTVDTGNNQVTGNTDPGMVEEYMKDLKGTGCKTWISAEPMLSPIEFSEGFLERYIDMVVIGARQFNDGEETPDEVDYGYVRKDDESHDRFQQPPYEDVLALSLQAKEAGCELYWKDNLAVPKETA